MYHSISTGNSLRVPEAEFRGHMKWLKDNGYYTLTPEEAYIVLTQDKMPSEKCVLITFDDGYTDNFEKAYPILKDYEMKATIFMIGKSVGRKNHLTESQMKEMAEHGIAIESHTINHVELNGLAPEQQLSEMTRSKTLFDGMLQQNTTMLSYPVGRYNAETLKQAEKAGYQMAVTTERRLLGIRGCMRCTGSASRRECRRTPLEEWWNTAYNRKDGIYHDAAFFIFFILVRRAHDKPQIWTHTFRGSAVYRLPGCGFDDPQKSGRRSCLADQYSAFRCRFCIRSFVALVKKNEYKINRANKTSKKIIWKKPSLL